MTEYFSDKDAMNFRILRDRPVGLKWTGDSSIASLARRGYVLREDPVDNMSSTVWRLNPEKPVVERAIALFAAMPARKSVKINGVEVVTDVPISWDNQPISVQRVFLQSAARGYHYSMTGHVYRWRGDGSVYRYLTMTPNRYHPRLWGRR